jgi:hypothetical protein
MPIIKLKKHQDQIPYDMVSREVVQSITNPIALAIWVYLQSQAEDWDVIESHIRKHFAIGQRKYQKAMKELKEFLEVLNIDIFLLMQIKQKEKNY